MYSSNQSNLMKDTSRPRWYSAGSEDDHDRKIGVRVFDNYHLTPSFSDSNVRSRTHSHSHVTFTIGDSSDNESISTTTSDFIGQQSTPGNLPSVLEDQRLSPPPGPDDSQFCNHNPWHKFHFHYEDNHDAGNRSGNLVLNGNGHQPAAGADAPVEGNAGHNAELRNEIRSAGESYGSSLHTTRIIPNDDFSLSRLADVNSEVEEDGNGSCGSRATSWFRNFGKWRILIACAIVQLFSGLTVSLQAPFYPAEAEKKGASATAYGFVFGVFELAVFFIAPFYGSRIHNWNPKLVFNIGIFTTAISSIIFGVLDKLATGAEFITACAIVRTVEACGESAVVTSSFIIVASSFPDSVASTFAILETFYSIGLISGPIVGSLLYQLGGYSLPFLVVGGSLIAAAVLNFVILPSSKEIAAFQRVTEPIIISSYKSFRLLGSVAVAVSAVSIVIGSMSISYLQATLEPHMRQFEISQLTIGAMLIITGGVYTLSAPIWGLICDRMLQLKLVTFSGAAVLLTGFALIGPVPILHFEQKLWIISLGLVLQGIGLGAILVSSFVSILRNVIVSGLPDNPSTYGLVSSLWTSMFSLGSFIGPSLSGILFDAVGFSWGSLSIIGCSAFMMCVLLIFVCGSDSELESFILDSEHEPLLHNASASFYSSNSGPQIQSGTGNGYPNHNGVTRNS